MGTGNIAMSYSGRLPEGFSIRVLNRERAEYALIGDPTSAVTNHGFTFNLLDVGEQPFIPIAIPIRINVYADTNDPDRVWSECNRFWESSDYILSEYHYNDELEYCDDTYGWKEGSDKETWSLWVVPGRYRLSSGGGSGYMRNIVRTVVTEAPGITVDFNSIIRRVYHGHVYYTVGYTADDGASAPETIEVRNTNEKYCLMATDTTRAFCKRQKAHTE